MTRSTFRAPLAAALSFLVPGLGQAFNRQFWLAALFALPILVAAGLAVSAATGGSAAAAALLDTRVLAAMIVLDVALLGWRIAAIVQAHLENGWGGFKRWASWATIFLVALSTGMHAVPAWYATATIQTLAAVSRGGTGAAGFFDGFPGTSANGEPTPKPTPVSITSRVTVLLVGIDYIPTRHSTYLTDTMIVATIDPRAGVGLISIPRDTFGTPLGDGRIYNSKLNGLLARAQREPGNYPLGGPETLKAAVGQLVGMKIDYIAAVQVLGFKTAIDALGGVDITVERAINDPTYIDEFAIHTGFYIQPGQYRMDGHTAVAYARSRKGSGDNDFTRAARQQQILVAVLSQLTAGNLLLNLPILLGIVGDSVASDVPIELLPHLARALQEANPSQIARLVIEYPLVRNDTLTDGTYILIPDIDAIQAAVRELITLEP